MRLPIDIATAQTATFICEWLGDTRRRVLEVGAGEGRVAVELVRRGHEVVAVDSDADAVARAVERGVDARLATWPNFSEAPFDAIAFTRSLHHIDDLDGAVARASALLVPKGLVLVEDFAFETLDDASVVFLRDYLRVIDAAVSLGPPDDSFASQVLAGHDSSTILAADNYRRLHAWSRMHAALLETFSAVDSCATPYMYRYPVRMAPERAELADVVAALLDAEVSSNARGWIRPFGRRFVGRRAAR